MQDEELGYRSPAAVGPAPAASNVDERELSTLTEVAAEFQAELAAIDSIHVFDLEEKSLTIKQQIAAYKKARTILQPLADKLSSAVDNVKIMQEERLNNG